MVEVLKEYGDPPKTAEGLLSSDIKAELQQEILVNDIITETALIDPTHAQSLGDSMKGSRGQISPITVRARIDNDLVVYDIIDGFHRVEAKKYLQEESLTEQTLKAVVLYGCNDEELYDLRVLAASSVKSIKFPRMADWMKKSFDSTRWSNSRISELIVNGDLSLSQVFYLAMYDNSGKNLGIKEEEAEELRDWGINKSKQWGRPISSLISDMRTVELAAPDLVQRVRTGGGGKGGKGVLTRARLQSLTKNLPGEWETQRLFADLAIDKNILAPDLDYLSWSYSFARDASDQETMTNILEHPEMFLKPQPPKQEDTEINVNNINYPNFRRREETVRTKKKRPESNKKNIVPVSETQLGEGMIYSARRNIQNGVEGDVFDSGNEIKVLIRNKIPEIIKSFIDLSTSGQNNDFTVLLLPKGRLSLSRRDCKIILGKNEVGLTKSESDLMTTFSLLEGVYIPENVLSVITVNEDSASEGVKTRDMVASLKDKIKSLDKEASQMLMENNEGEFGWLVE